MAKDTKKKEWKPRKVDGKIQRARTYAPGWDVICVRAPASVIDKIRSSAKSGGKSISATVAEKFGFKLDGKTRKAPKAKTSKPAKKAAPKKAAKAKTKEPNHAQIPNALREAEAAQESAPF
jgi:hypothetical protein